MKTLTFTKKELLVTSLLTLLPTITKSETLQEEQRVQLHKTTYACLRKLENFKPMPIVGLPGNVQEEKEPTEQECKDLVALLTECGCMAFRQQGNAALRQMHQSIGANTDAFAVGTMARHYAREKFDACLDTVAKAEFQKSKESNRENN